jgi:hypothetical protein
MDFASGFYDNIIFHKSLSNYWFLSFHFLRHLPPGLEFILLAVQEKLIQDVAMK